VDISNAVAIAAPFTAGQEGFRAAPYWDVNGYAIGYGNHYYEDGTAVGQDDDPITPARGLQIMSYTLAHVAGQIAPMLQVPVSDSTLAALTDLGYNWGVGNVGNSVLLQLINQGAPADQVATQWNKTALTSGGVLNSDLVARRAAESDLAQSGTDTLGLTALALAALFIVGFLYFSAKKH
jgi:GH24 family phage-related lysozyme (muramidase)